MTNFSKVALGIASLGTIGGCIGCGFHFFNNSENKSALKFRLISEGFDTNLIDSDWTTIEEAHSKSKNAFSMPSTLTNKKEWLKNHCETLIREEDKKNINYGKAIQWCVKKEKIADILKKENSKFRTLNTEAQITEQEKNIWKQKITSLSLPEKSSAKASLAVELNGGDDDAKIKEVQGKCKTLIEVETIGEDFGNKLTLAKDWCSIQKDS